MLNQCPSPAMHALGLASGAAAGRRVAINGLVIAAAKYAQVELCPEVRDGLWLQVVWAMLVVLRAATTLYRSLDSGILIRVHMQLQKRASHPLE